MEEALVKLKRIKRAALFFSPRSGNTFSEHGMITMLRYWARQQYGGLREYLNGLANALEENIGGSNASRS